MLTICGSQVSMCKVPVTVTRMWQLFYQNLSVFNNIFSFSGSSYVSVKLCYSEALAAQ